MKVQDLKDWTAVQKEFFAPLQRISMLTHGVILSKEESL